MSAELRELRARITVEADAALDCVAKGSGRDRSEIARDVLHVWALEQMTIANLLMSKLKAEGLLAAVERHQSGNKVNTP